MNVYDNFLSHTLDRKFRQTFKNKILIDIHYKTRDVKSRRNCQTFTVIWPIHAIPSASAPYEPHGETFTR